LLLPWRSDHVDCRRRTSAAVDCDRAERALRTAASGRKQKSDARKLMLAFRAKRKPGGTATSLPSHLRFWAAALLATRAAAG
jgi:hypothetical protein